MRVLRALIVGAAVLAAFGPAPPALAQSRIQVSADARTWSADLSAPVFDPSVRWIPGDVRSGTFYVRNQAAGDGTLAVAARVLDRDALVRNGDVALQIRRDNGSWTSLPADDRGHQLTRPGLAPGQTARIDIKVVFAPASPNRSQASRLHLDFRVLLVEATDVAGPLDGGGAGGLLPDTGGVTLAVLLAGACCTVAGGVIVASVTRTRRTEGQP